MELLPAVQEALEIYLSETNPLLGIKHVFRSIHTPYRPLSRSAAWSIAAARIKSSVEAKGRKRGTHAIRSSLASRLIADNVPYPVVQKVLGHAIHLGEKTSIKLVGKGRKARIVTIPAH